MKKGDVLYVIDPRPYQAALKHAQAELARARTQLALAKSERERATRLIEKRAISQEEFDARTSGNEQAGAECRGRRSRGRCGGAGSVVHAGARADRGPGGPRRNHRGQLRSRRSDAC